MPGTSYCSVFGCSNNSKSMPHLTYFGIPKSKQSREKWMSAIDRADLLTQKNSAFVCSTHFSKAMLVNRRLKRDAIPTLNLPISRSARTSPCVKRRRIDLMPVDPPASKEISTQTIQDIDIETQDNDSEVDRGQPSVSVGTQTISFSFEWARQQDVVCTSSADEVQTVPFSEIIPQNNELNNIKVEEINKTNVPESSIEEPMDIYTFLKTEPNSPPEVNLEYITDEEVLI